MKYNLYYYFFYKISAVIKKIGRKDNDYIESGCAFFSVNMALNVIFILSFLAHFFNFKISGSYLFSAVIVLPIWFLNRVFLVKNRNGEKIFSFFDNHHVKRDLFKKNALLVIYICLSFGLPVVLGYLHRQGKW